MQKTYQTLQANNKDAAKLIYNALKKDKAISEKRFGDLFCQRPGGARRGGSFDTLTRTTKQFLFDHGLMTKEYINGLILYVATQKCFRTKNFENATRICQVTSNDAIDRAIEYVKLNNNMVPAEYEGPIVATMLGLEGETWDVRGKGEDTIWLQVGGWWRK
jgi:hypothetical protein